tara:strand:+ start:15 stop:656 length:642 start_codon:yes stop_codon:yes gene_type:complete
MNNSDLVKEVLREYFSDFKEYHLIILVAFTIIIAIVQVAQAIWVSRKIEKFKNDLKKSEIKFSRFNELQIKILSESYQLLSDFNESTLNVTQDSLSPEKMNKRAKKWFEDYYNFHKHYSRNKFIFLPRIKAKLTLIFSTFEKMKTIVKIEHDTSQKLYTDDHGYAHFKGSNKDLERLLNELGTLNKNDTIKYTLSNIENLKKEIEDFFSALES